MNIGMTIIFDTNDVDELIEIYMEESKNEEEVSLCKKYIDEESNFIKKKLFTQIISNFLMNLITKNDFNGFERLKEKYTKILKNHVVERNKIAIKRIEEIKQYLNTYSMTNRKYLIDFEPSPIHELQVNKIESIINKYKFNGILLGFDAECIDTLLLQNIESLRVDYTYLYAFYPVLFEEKYIDLKYKIWIPKDVMDGLKNTPDLDEYISKLKSK